MKNKVINLALIGKGRWGQNYIKTIRSNLPNVSLLAQNIKTRNYPELLDRQEEIDGVIIATSTNTHFEIAKTILDKGVNYLLIEKPVTQTLQEALKLQKIIERLKATVMVGHIQLFDPAYQEIKQHLNDIGKIKTLTYHGLQSPARNDSTVLQDWGAHPIYLFTDIMKKNPDKISAKTLQNGNNDNVKLTLEFGKVPATAYIGWTSPKRERKFEVVGSKGSLVLDWSGHTKQLILKPNTQPIKKLEFPTDRQPLEIQILEFAHCIQTGQEPKAPFSQGLDVMKILDAAEKSLNG